MRHAPYARVFPVHAGSRRIDTAAAPVPVAVARAEAWGLYHAAQHREAETRKPGRQDGAITRNGLAVLRILINYYMSWTTGQCDPTYETIAAAAAISVRSVHRGLVALRNAKVLDWWARCKSVAGPFGGFLLEQVSNLYKLNLFPWWRKKSAPLPPAPPPDPDTIGAPTPIPDDPEYDRSEAQTKHELWAEGKRESDAKYQQFLTRRRGGAV